MLPFYFVSTSQCQNPAFILYLLCIYPPVYHSVTYMLSVFSSSMQCSSVSASSMYCNFSQRQLLRSSNPAIMSFDECLKSLYFSECEIFNLIHSLIKLRWHGPAAACLFLFSINFSQTCEILIAFLIKIKTKIIITLNLQK